MPGKVVRLPAARLGIGHLRQSVGVARAPQRKWRGRAEHEHRHDSRDPELCRMVRSIVARWSAAYPILRMLLSGSKRGWVAAYLAVALAGSIVWLLLDQRLAEQTGLRRQVWLAGDFEGAPFINDISPDATLDFLEDDPRLPREFFTARWTGYWYVPSSQFVVLHVGADDYADIWIDGELPFAKSTAAARGIRLDAGVHELRIDYQQYGGASSLLLHLKRSGAYLQPLGAEYLFPDLPEPPTLQLVTAIGWLRTVVALTWGAGGLALLTLRRRRASTTGAKGPRSQSLTRYDDAALTALCVALLVYGYGNMSLRQSSSDSLENLTLGIRLAQEGVYQRWPGQFGDHRREPFGPLLVAVTDLATEALNRGAVPSECVSDEIVVRRDYCRQAFAPYRALNLALLLAGALGVFWLLFRLTGVRALAYIGFLLTAQSAVLLNSADSFLTEVHTAALMVAVAALSWTTATSRRPLHAALLGLALAALVLTKAVFVYLWIPIALMLAAADWLRQRVDWTTAGLVGVLCAAHLIPVGGWMARNYLMSGDFSIVEARSASVLGLRVSFNTMRHDEWARGFAYYLPLTRETLQSAGIPEVSFERFDMDGENGFRQTSRRRNARRRAELWTDDNPAIVGLDELGQRRWVNDAMRNEAMARLVVDPVQHLKVSLLLAWRGVFTEEGLGFLRLSDPFNPRLAEVIGWNDWARWHWAYSPIVATIVNLIGVLALIVVPLWFWLGRGRFEAMLIFVPAIYAHGVYTLASHFLPRYAEPQIPLRVTATMLLLYLAWTSLRGTRLRTDQN